MVTVRDVYNLQLDGVELLTGEAGLDRMVSWTYDVQTKPYSDHMNPGNFALIVIDDVRYSFETAYDAMLELNDLGISAFGISVVDDREKVPEKLLNKAIELELPVFFIRWQGSSFVDISQSIG
ncbi:MAG: PucR family transcriptional regulator ligand-binding domain-containing protein, partial [Spirochaetaceae bacterium]|nr:PucR family transcriptional regulator ligand-binding domain-containing protein [Spirochaetaceae bacterium]